MSYGNGLSLNLWLAPTRSAQRGEEDGEKQATREAGARDHGELARIGDASAAWSFARRRSVE
jgi:hypothetical protein